MARLVLSERWYRMKVLCDSYECAIDREQRNYQPPAEYDSFLYLSLKLITYDDGTFEIRGMDSPNPK